MAYMPVVLLLNEYFPDKFVIYNIYSLFGYTAGAMVLPVITERALEAYDYEGAFLILGGITLHLMVCGAAVRRPEVVHLRAVRDQSCDHEDDAISVNSQSGACDTDDDKTPFGSCTIAPFRAGLCEEENEGTDREGDLEEENIAGCQNECSPMIQDPVDFDSLHKMWMKTQFDE